MNFHLVDPSNLKNDPAKHGAVDQNDRLQVLPHDFWKQFSQPEIAAFCAERGLYCIPTTELVSWLKEQFGDRKTIEIGSGSGVLAAALNIQATDNCMQNRPEIRAQLAAPPVRYGPNVQMLDGLVAATRHKPKIVLAAWVTHRYNPKEHWREGNQYGVDERKVLKLADYIHIGNRYVHRNKPIMDLPHEEFEFPWLVSRALNGSPNFICAWKKIP